MRCPNEHRTDPHRVIIVRRSVLTSPDNLIEVPWNMKRGKVGDAAFAYVLPMGTYRATDDGLFMIPGLWVMTSEQLVVRLPLSLISHQHTLCRWGQDTPTRWRRHMRMMSMYESTTSSAGCISHAQARSRLLVLCRDE
jgi:hypothetical protein